MQEKLNILKNLPGVNQDVFTSNIQKHLVAIECINIDDLIEDINIYDEYAIPYVKESGIIDFQKLAFTKEEALAFANENSNVISLEDFYEKGQGRVA